MNGDLYFDGQRYISSSRAAKITGYVNDYIGQLCRDGKLDCRMVGRSWYVGFDSLIKHKNSNANGTRSRGSQKKLRSTTLASLSEPVTSVESEAVSQKPVLISYPVFSLPTPVVLPLLDTEVARPNPNTYASPRLPKQSLFLRAGIGISAFTLAMVGFWFSLSNHNPSARIYSALWQESTAILEANVFSGARNILDKSALAWYQAVRGWLFDSRETMLVLTGESITNLDNPRAVTTAQAGPDRGMVVVPTTPEMDQAKTVEAIKKSFSDEVDVSQRDKDTGVITPVFKDDRGDEYLYVLVPIDG